MISTARFHLDLEPEIALQAVQLSAGLYYIGDTNLPNTHNWHAGVDNLTMNTYFGVVQHVLHHNPPNNITFRSSCSWLPFESGTRRLVTVVPRGTQLEQPVVQNLRLVQLPLM